MKNNYEVRGEYTVIFIDSPKYGMKEVLISTNKLERAKEFPGSWRVLFAKVTKSFYVRGNTTRVNGKQGVVRLHRWITNAPKDMVVDHINHDTLDNTDKNLRVVNQAENMQNLKGAKRNSKSGIRGVCWDDKHKRWQAKIGMNSKQNHVGYFKNVEDAKKAVIEARKKYMPYSQETEAM